jgi:hypothetical protein
MDFLYGLGQVVCIIGLLYGAYLSITYVEHADPRRAASGRTPAEPKPKPGIEYDPLTSHVWTSTHPDLTAK